MSDDNIVIDRPEITGPKEAYKAIKATVKEALKVPGGRVLVLSIVPTPEGNATRIVSNCNPGVLLIDSSDVVHDATSHWLEKNNRVRMAEAKKASHE